MTLQELRILTNRTINKHIETATSIPSTKRDRMAFVEEINKAFQRQPRLMFYGTIDGSWEKMVDISFRKAEQHNGGYIHLLFWGAEEDRINLENGGIIKPITLQNELSGLYLESKTEENPNFRRLYLMKDAEL